MRNQNHFYNINSTIHEHKAPTDESIKLYKELKEKAESSIFETITVQNNILNTDIAVFIDTNSYNKFIRYILKINGETVTGDIKVDTGLSYDRNKILQHVYKDIAEHIAESIMVKLDYHQIKFITNG